MYEYKKKREQNKIPQKSSQQFTIKITHKNFRTFYYTDQNDKSCKRWIESE